MSLEPSATDARRLYDEVMASALRHAARRVPRAEAMEVAHDVACALVCRHQAGLDDPNDTRSLDGLIYRAVWNRLNNMKRGNDRRAAAERVHFDERTRIDPAWVAADGAMNEAELSRLIEDTIGDMPEAMRRVFLLVRLKGLSYKDAASRLGIGVGTVHTQLARASQRLRETVDRYHADVDRDSTSKASRKPL